LATRCLLVKGKFDIPTTVYIFKRYCSIVDDRQDNLNQQLYTLYQLIVKLLHIIKLLYFIKYNAYTSKCAPEFHNDF
jgi:hypothetical protein